MHLRLSSSLAILGTLVCTSIVLGHCQVPCGIYADQRRFEELLEDTATIAKAIDQIKELNAKDGDPVDHNQLVRWVMTKESHASNMQKIVADYFLTQRIKPTNDRYTEQLKASHAVMVAAMKCKQNVDPATATALKEAVFDLYRAYEGKEPQLEDHK